MVRVFLESALDLLPKPQQNEESFCSLLETGKCSLAATDVSISISFPFFWPAMF